MLSFVIPNINDNLKETNLFYDQFQFNTETLKPQLAILKPKMQYNNLPPMNQYIQKKSTYSACSRKAINLITLENLLSFPPVKYALMLIIICN